MDDKLYWLWLSLKEGIPVRDMLKLVRIFGSAKAIYETAEYDVSLRLAPEHENELMDKSLDDAQKVIEKTEAMGGYILTLGDEQYPNYLSDIAVPPPVLYCKGMSMSMNKPFMITVVGTRRYSDYGRLATEHIVKELVRYGAVIVSGMARGIDSIASRTALDAGGETVAVLGSGLDVIYPPENRELYERITEQGVVITEFPPGTKPMRYNFPRRNRIMSGLSLGLLIGQAPARSGALISAAYASSDGRNVYVIPSGIFDDDFAGSNELIKAGAKLVRSAEDIIEDFGYLELKKHRTDTVKAEPDTSALSETEAQIVKMLSSGRLHIDEISRGMGLDSGEVNTMLMLLEINGIVKKHNGNIYGIE